MKRLVNRIPAALLLSVLFATTVLAQTSAQEMSAKLRDQLSEVEIRKAELQARDDQLQEDLRPENIERSLAGIVCECALVHQAANVHGLARAPVGAAVVLAIVQDAYGWKRLSLKQTPKPIGKAPASSFVPPKDRMTYRDYARPLSLPQFFEN